MKLFVWRWRCNCITTPGPYFGMVYRFQPKVLIQIAAVFDKSQIEKRIKIGQLVAHVPVAFSTAEPRLCITAGPVLRPTNLSSDECR
ncbi:MAG: hypothetical protein L6Q97_18780, partial [Thermoanaerobaculia bacterium]|nr:hypothetical protein [Thermoanaerobaculia bacterium]